jgi:hypothetical protein
MSAAAARKLYSVVLRRGRSLDERATNDLRERLRSAPRRLRQAERSAEDSS